MAEKEEIDIDDPKVSELSSLEELDLNDQIEIIPDQEEVIEPQDVSPEEDIDEDAEKESGKPDSDIFNEVDLPSTPDDGESENFPEESEPEKSADVVDDQDQEELVEPLDVFPEEVVDEDAEKESGKSDSDIFNEEELPSIPDGRESEILPEESEPENSADILDEQKDGEIDLDELDDGDFLGLDDEEFDDETPEESDPPQEEVVKSQEKDKSEKDLEPANTRKAGNDDNKHSLKPAKKFRAKITLGRPLATQIIVGLTLLLMGIAGGVFYMNPALLGFKAEAQPVPLKAAEPTPPVQAVQKQVESPKHLSENEKYLAKLNDAGLLRDELLEKKEEIYRLKLLYQNGIADLEDQISRELQKEGITSYRKALKNKRIELNLRTIQRRRSYIHGLEKPARWIKQGSEELLYLKRKAEFDLLLIDIAGGIDMDKHMRHISAAIQKYRPSAEKLAVDRENTNRLPLETIWGQIKNTKKKTGKMVPTVTDREITKEICAGNYERTAELTSMSAAAAQCLSKKNGSDLFLNGLPTLSPTAAKHLFQWRGSWICINGIKKLSPAAAQYLFKWEGNWISLNGLVAFPPELATYLMEWEGKQLELMGLRYNKKNADQKALKYLALWETMGGKLFISDDVRKEIERVLM